MFGLKQLVFTREDNINVSYKITLQNVNNLEENFNITDLRQLDTPQEIRLFYWLYRGGVWTLNELIFFAINNDLCINIYDHANNLVKQYGKICGTNPF